MAGASGTSNFTAIKEASNSIEATEEQEEITNYEPSLNENIDEQQDLDQYNHSVIFGI